jgi:hypothetical protein
VQKPPAIDINSTDNSLKLNDDDLHKQNLILWIDGSETQGFNPEHVDLTSKLCSNSNCERSTSIEFVTHAILPI